MRMTGSSSAGFWAQAEAADNDRMVKRKALERVLVIPGESQP
jgi:hypothetical protein